MMDAKTKKLKQLIKAGVATEQPTFGTNPRDPWSAKADISEATPTGMLSKYLKSRGIDPKYVSKDQKDAHTKTGEFQTWLSSHVNEDIVSEDGGSDQVKAKQLMDKFLVARGIDPRYVTKDEKDAHSKSGEFDRWVQNHLSSAHEEYVPEDLGYLATQGQGGKTKERTSDIKKSSSSYKEIKTPRGPGTHNEDVYQDPQAATQTVFDGANNTNDVSERALSKAAKLIKKIYNKKVNEDLYDHEKADKSVATYGKKPKFDKTDPKESQGEKKPQAAAVLSGGTTLTGEPRDTIEIDPAMRNRPGQPDVTKKDDDKKDDKKKKDK
jgi:hypothetical protein